MPSARDVVSIKQGVAPSPERGLGEAQGTHAHAHPLGPVQRCILLTQTSLHTTEHSGAVKELRLPSIIHALRTLPRSPSVDVRHTQHWL